LADELKEVSAARFFYENRDLAGFSTPARSMFTAVRELVENAFDAAESAGILPDVNVQVTSLPVPEGSVPMCELTVEDNGCGVNEKLVPAAFGQILVSSKYKRRQMRGVFGMGGKMAILYSQITTHHPAKIWTSTGKKVTHYFEILIDIDTNTPVVLKHKRLPNPERKKGTKVSIILSGVFSKATPKILEYFKRTAMVAPYANITYTTPDGEQYLFKRAVDQVPKTPVETTPHPHGVDLELLDKAIENSSETSLVGFLTENFDRVGKGTANKFLEFAGIPKNKRPKKLSRDERVTIMHKMHEFKFLPPTGDCLSPIGEAVFRAGIQKELEPEFITVQQRRPSAYGGHPFIIEVAVAYGGKIQPKERFLVYRFANRIPLLYDPGSDVIVKIVRLFNWRQYCVEPNTPLAVFVHLCSTKIPYKTVGKEYIAERFEIEKEIMNGLHVVARELRQFLSKKIKREHAEQRREVYSKYLSKINEFASSVIKREPADLEPVLNKVLKYKEVEQDAQTSSN